MVLLRLSRIVPNILLVLALFMVLADSAGASPSVVKRTDSGLCHPPQSSYYNRVKSYKPYANLDACLASGGRLPKSLQSMPSHGATNDDEYDRGEFGHGWLEDDDPDCQDTRAELLVERSQSPVQFASDRQCRVVSGLWVGFFSNEVFTDAGAMDLDHIVPLAAAWNMGADEWTDELRTRFANDPLNLQFTSASLNRSTITIGNIPIE